MKIVFYERRGDQQIKVAQIDKGDPQLARVPAVGDSIAFSFELGIPRMCRVVGVDLGEIHIAKDGGVCLDSDVEVDVESDCPVPPPALEGTDE